MVYVIAMSELVLKSEAGSDRVEVSSGVFHGNVDGGNTVVSGSGQEEIFHESPLELLSRSDPHSITLGKLINVGLWADAEAREDRVFVQLAGKKSWESKLLSELVGQGGGGSGICNFDDYFYEKDGKLYCRLDLIGEKEVAAYGEGRGGTGGGGGASSVGQLTNVGEWADEVPGADRVFVQLAGNTHWSSKLLSELLDENNLEAYLARKKYATQSWVLDQGYLTSESAVEMGRVTGLITALNDKLDKTSWNRYFYEKNGKLYCKLDFVGEREVSAYGEGVTGGGGFDEIALGVYLETNKYVTETWVESRGFLKSIPAHTHVWGDITDKPLSFTPSKHSHVTGDIVSGTFDVARIPNLPIGKVTGLSDALDKKVDSISFSLFVDTFNTMFEVAEGKIKAKMDFYSIGGISAYGERVGGSGGGMDEGALAAYLDTNKYVTEAWIEAQGFLKTISVHNHVIADVTGLQSALNSKEGTFLKNSGFNKDFGTTAGTVVEGNDSRVVNGQTAYNWGNHGSVGYLKSITKAMVEKVLTGNITTHTHSQYLTTHQSLAGYAKETWVSENFNKYVHPSGAGNNHIPAGGSTGQWLKWSATGTAVWASPANLTIFGSTYSPNAALTLATIPAGKVTGTVSRAAVFNSSGVLAVSSVTLTELGYVSGVTSSVQAQINSKLAASIWNTYFEVKAGKLYCNVDFISKGNVSAYGEGVGGSGGGMDEGALAAYLDTNKYVTEAWIGAQGFLKMISVHNHVVADVTGLQVALNTLTNTFSGYLPLTAGSGKILSGMLFANNSVRIGASGNGSKGGILFWSPNWKAWQIYMASAGGTGGANAIKAPAGSYVTTYALRSAIESNSGYGWTWESGSSTGDPTVVAELRSSDGYFYTKGGIGTAGAASVNTLTITNTGVVAHVGLARVGYNYLWATKAAGVLAFGVNGDTLGAANTALHINTNKYVGIGYTDVSDYRLKVNGTGFFSGGITLPNDYAFRALNTAGTAISLLYLNVSNNAIVGNTSYPLYLSSSATNLTHNRAGTNYTIWDSYNFIPNNYLQIKNVLSNSCVFRDVLGYYTGASSSTGTLKITLPNTWTSTMLSFEINLFSYNGDSGSRYIVSGYNYNSTSSSWVNTGATVIGRNVGAVRLAHDGSKCCILIGTTTSTWNYLRVVISKVEAHYASSYNSDSWKAGYSVSFLTNETGITNIVTPSLNFPLYTRGGTMTGNLVVNGTTTLSTTTITGGLTLGTNWVYASGGNGLLRWDGSINTIGVQSGTTTIRSGVTDLTHNKGGSVYKIWDASNLTNPANQQQVNNFVHSGNEITLANGYAGGDLWINYRGATAAIVNYRLGNGLAGGGVANLYANNLYSAGNLVATQTWVSANFNKYVHPSGAGNNHVPAGGSTGQWLKWSATGVAAWLTPAILTRGSYLTGSNYNCNSATTWAVDATSTNTAGKVVVRDSSGNFSAGTITAALAGNASTTTKLATARTIWGQSFDGSGNVTGAVSGATTGSFSGRVTAGGLTLGYNNTSYVLSTSSFICNSWVRTTGSTGWFNETYSGGMYMTDTTWVRIYNSKKLYVPSTAVDSVRTDGGFVREGYAGTSWYQGQGALGVAIVNNSAQTPLLVAYRSGQAANVTGANRLFSLEFLNTGTTMYFAFAGAKKFEMTSAGNFFVEGGITAKGEVMAYSASDVRLKRNIKALDGLATLRQLKFKKFDWTDEARELTRDNRQHGYGLIAQEAQTVLPEIVNEIYGSEFLGVNYAGLIPFLGAAILQHEDELTRLRKRVKRLEQEVKRLNSIA